MVLVGAVSGDGTGDPARVVDPEQGVTEDAEEFPAVLAAPPAADELDGAVRAERAAEEQLVRHSAAAAAARQARR